MLDNYSNFKITRSLGLLLTVMAFATTSWAQQTGSEMGYQIKGFILDEYGNPVENATLTTVANDSLTTSAADGSFELEVTETLKTVIAHPEFYTETYYFEPVNRFNPVEIRLDSRLLKVTDEIHTIYDSRSKKAFLGSQSTIYTDQLTTTLAQTYVHALPGRLTGLYTEQYRGMRSAQTNANTTSVFLNSIPNIGAGSVASDNTQFFISSRGQGPVVVIDGVQRDLSSIDPQNIESISIQKDALSSLFLGMRSSRGVLVVTTKEADATGFKLSFTQETGFQNSLNMPDPLPAYQYAYLLNEGLLQDGNSPVYTQADFNAYRNGTDPINHPNVNWYDEVLKKNAPISLYNINMRGGNESAKYFLSLGYFTQEGFFKTSSLNSYNTNEGLDRYLVNTKLDVDVTDEFNVKLSLFGRIEEGNQPGATTNQILQDLYTTPNNAYPIFNPNGSYGGTRSFTRNLYASTLNSGYIKDIKKDVLATVNLEYDMSKFVNGLSFKGISSVSVQNRTAIRRARQNLVYAFTPADEGEGGTYDTYGTLSPQSNDFIASANSNYWYGQAGFKYERSFDKHNIDAEFFGDQYVVSTNFDLPNRPADIALSVKYNFDEKYFAEAAAVESYFNGYAPGQQWGLFYAFGLGWDIAKENLFAEQDWLNSLKLRGVYGKTGNGIDNAGYYIWRQSYSTVSQFDGRAYPQGYSYAVGRAVVENEPLYNPNISWEKAHKLNVGLDFLAFQNKFQITGDYYIDNYYDLLQQRGKSIELLGISYPNENIGKNRYQGLELSVTYQNNIGDFNYFVTGNWSQQKSERIFLDEQFRPEEYNKLTGKPVNTIFGYVADGFFESEEEIANSATTYSSNVGPGDIKFKDLNNDGIINDFDLTPIGNTKPLSYYGINAGFKYRGIDFSFLIQGVYNRDIYFNNDVLLGGFTGIAQTYGQAYAPILNRWTPETAATATLPRVRPGTSFFNQSPNLQQNSSLFVFSGDYVRLKNVSIGYTFPDEITNYLAGMQLRIFANGTNLFTESAFDLGDPEVTSFTSYPIQRVISGGLNVKF